MSKRAWTDLLPDLFGRRRISELECELEEAHGQIDDLNGEMGVVADEFEKECWRSLRQLMDRFGFNWREVTGDGVTAAEAEDFINTRIDDLRRNLDQHSTALINSQFLIIDLQNALRIFVRHYEPWMDRYADDLEVSTFPRHTFGELRKAVALLPVMKDEVSP